MGGKSRCTGMRTTNQNTYYAPAIYAAQASLTAQKAANQGTENVMIILSDGNATAQKTDMVTDSSRSPRVATGSGLYPSWVGECSQGVDAAKYAMSQGTTVYTIAYGASSSSSGGSPGNCASDRQAGAKYGHISPCSAMQRMSSGWDDGDHSNFYSDFYAPHGDTGCQASDENNAVTSLDNIFKSISFKLSSARLIPNDTE
jgi:hypothetical protein